MCISPVVGGIVSAGASIIGGIARHRGEAKAAETQDQYNQQVYAQQLDYARRQESYQMRLKRQQDRFVRDTRYYAADAYRRDTETLQARLMEEELASRVELESLRMERIRAVGAIRASEKTGRGVNRLMRDFYAQEGRYRAIEQNNQKFQRQQTIRELYSAKAEAISRYNSAREYIPSPVQYPTPPTATARPSLLRSALQIGGGVLGAYNSYQDSNPYTARTGTNNTYMSQSSLPQRLRIPRSGVRR